MGSSKFSSSRRPGKTPAICRKSVKPKPATIPDSDHPIIHPRPLYASIEWKSINPDHPWHYAARQLLPAISPVEWYTEVSLDPDFQLEIRFTYSPPTPTFAAFSVINHQYHGDHVGTYPYTLYDNGNAFYIPRIKLDTSPYPRYQCYLAISL